MHSGQLSLKNAILEGQLKIFLVWNLGKPAKMPKCQNASVIAYN
jgi:hypothetical protein